MQGLLEVAGHRLLPVHWNVLHLGNYIGDTEVDITLDFTVTITTNILRGRNSQAELKALCSAAPPPQCSADSLHVCFFPTAFTPGT